MGLQFRVQGFGGQELGFAGQELEFTVRGQELGFTV